MQMVQASRVLLFCLLATIAAGHSQNATERFLRGRGGRHRGHPKKECTRNKIKEMDDQRTEMISSAMDSIATCYLRFESDSILVDPASLGPQRRLAEGRRTGAGRGRRSRAKLEVKFHMKDNIVTSNMMANLVDNSESEQFHCLGQDKLSVSMKQQRLIDFQPNEKDHSPVSILSKQPTERPTEPGNSKDSLHIAFELATDFATFPLEGNCHAVWMVDENTDECAAHQFKCRGKFVAHNEKGEQEDHKFEARCGTADWTLRGWNDNEFRQGEKECLTPPLRRLQASISVIV